MRCLEEPARLAQNHPVTHRYGSGDTPTHAPNLDRCLEVEVLPIEALKPYAGNARTHSKRQLRQIAKSIERFGFCNPVLIDGNRQIIAGHGRVAAAKLLGLSVVPTVRLSTSPRPRSEPTSLPTTAWLRRPVGTATFWPSSCRP